MQLNKMMTSSLINENKIPNNDSINLIYLILAHKNPKQLERLINALDSKFSSFIIHIDKNTQIEEFFKLLSHRKNVHFILERVEAIWGGFGIVEATLNSLKYVANNYSTKGYVILLSGQDYPIKSNQFILNFFNKNYGKVFIETAPLPFLRWAKGGMPRLEDYWIVVTRTLHVNFRGGRALLFNLKNNLLNVYSSYRLLSHLKGKAVPILLKNYKMLLKKRTIPNYIKPFGGSQWWAMPIESVKKVLQFLKNNPDYYEYHKYTFIPDEVFFHSIISGSGEDFFVENKTLTYTNFVPPILSSPAVLKQENIETLKESLCLFARKFDIEIDDGVLDLLDKENNSCSLDIKNNSGELK